MLCSVPLSLLKLKKKICGKRFAFVDDVERAAEENVRSCRMSLPGRNTQVGEMMDQVLQVKGYYPEKQNDFLTGNLSLSTRLTSFTLPLKVSEMEGATIINTPTVMMG